MFKEVSGAILFAAVITLTACSSDVSTAHQKPDKGGKKNSLNSQQDSDLISVIAALHDQMHSWQGTPYHWGGTDLKGVDCSGFVWRTLKDRFNLPLERVTTRQLIHMGKPVSKKQLVPGDLVFFRIHRQLHVGFYDTNQHFFHASYSKGVIRSSLRNSYWKSVFYQARRLPGEYKAEISFNSAQQHDLLAKN